MSNVELHSIRSHGDGCCLVVLRIEGRERELLCTTVQAHGIKAVTSRPDELDRIGVDPRPLVAAILAFLNAQEAYAEVQEGVSGLRV